MGIKGLLPFLEQKGAPPARFALRDFAGCAVAVDAQGYVHALRAVAWSRAARGVDPLQEDPDPDEVRLSVYSALLRLSLRWLSHGVTPVFVFDGRAPEEKKQTRAKRQAEVEKRQQRLRDLRKKVLEASDADRRDAAQLLSGLGGLPPAEAQLAAGFLESMGLPCLRAEGEGEALCALGTIEGWFAAAFSRDSDCLAYGCPLLLTDSDNSAGAGLVGYRLSRVLEALALPFPQFVDLCIMAGCDYNKNMRGAGIVTSYGLLRGCGAIERLPAARDPSCLNFRRCRQLFDRRPAAELVAAAPAPVGATAPQDGGDGFFSVKPQQGAPGDGRPRLFADVGILRTRGQAALEQLGLSGEYYEDLLREMSAVGEPMSLAPRPPV